MYKLMLCRLYLKRLGLIALLLIVANLLLSLIVSPLTAGTLKQEIPRDLIYYEGADVSSYEQYATDNNLEYSLSPSIHGKKDFAYSLGEGALEPIYLYDLNYLKDTSQELITSNLNTLNKDNEKFIDMNTVYISMFPAEINDYKTYNERLEIKQVLVGEYPRASNQLLIPEVYAISIANSLGLESYGQLVGQNIELLGDDYEIVGVYSGSNHIIVYPNQDLAARYSQYLDEAIFIKFDNSQQREELFDAFNSDQFVNSSDFYINNIKFILPMFLELLILLLSFVFIVKEQSQYVLILNHHNYTLANTLLPLLLPWILLTMLTLII